MKTKNNFLINELIYGGHMQCLGVVGIVYLSSYLINININFFIFISVYLSFYLIYINDRISGIKQDKITNKERTNHLEKHYKFILYFTFFVSIFLIFILIYLGNIKFLIFISLLTFLGFLYPYIIKKLTKKIFILKNIYVSIFFALISVAPIIYYNYSLNLEEKTILFLFITFVFLKTILMQIFLDCKDIEGDITEGLKTFPIKFGRKKTFTFLKISNIIIVLLFLFFGVFLFNILKIEIISVSLILFFNFYSYKLASEKKYLGYILGSVEFFFIPIPILLLNLF